MAETPNDPKQGGWLQEAWRRLRAPRAGDTVAASVQQSQNVTIGKNIVQIGTLAIPAAPLILLIVIALVVTGAFAWQQSRGPTTMAGSYNIAVADFAETTASGAVVASPRGQLLSEWVGRALVRMNDQMTDGSANTLIWYEALPHGQKAVRLGQIDGITPQARREQAQALAKKIGANIIMYGTVNAERMLTLEFYVAHQSSAEADWFAGLHQLGSRPIAIDGPTDAVDDELSAQATTFFLLTRGLRLASRGQSESAFRLLQQATSTASAMPGREIALDFQGAMALFSAQRVAATDTNAFEQYMADANTAFRAAIAANPNYGRAYIGLGSIAKYRADRLLQQQTPVAVRAQVEQDIAEALTHYTKAQSLGAKNIDQLWSAAIPAASLGSAYRTLGDLYALLGADARTRGETIAQTDFNTLAEHNIDLALQELTPVIAALRDTNEYRLLGQTYLVIGHAMEQKAYLRGAASDATGRETWASSAQKIYQACVALGEIPAASADRVLTDLVIDGEHGCRVASQRPTSFSGTAWPH